MQLLRRRGLREEVRRDCVRHSRVRRGRLGLFLLFVDFLAVMLLVTLFFLEERAEEHEGTLIRLRITGNELGDLGDRLRGLGLILHSAGCVGRRCVNRMFGLYSSCVYHVRRCHGGLGHGLGTKRLRSLGGVVDSASAVDSRVGSFCRGFSSVVLRLCPSFMRRFGDLLHPRRRVRIGSKQLGARLHVRTLVQVKMASDRGVTRFLRYSLRAMCGGHSVALGGSSLDGRRFLQTIGRIYGGWFRS